MTQKAKTIWGILCLVVPGSLFIFVLGAYGVSSFVISQIMVAGDSDLASTIGSLVTLVLGLVGIISMIGIPVGLVIGLILLTSRNKTEESVVEPEVVEVEKTDVL